MEAESKLREMATKWKHEPDYSVAGCKDVSDPLPCSPDCRRCQLETVQAAHEEGGGDSRTIQEVLQLHVQSSESMKDVYRRAANSDMENWQDGFTEGVKRAIEVADYRAALTSQDPPTICSICGCQGVRSTGACTCSCHVGLSDAEPSVAPAPNPAATNTYTVTDAEPSEIPEHALQSW